MVLLHFNNVAKYDDFESLSYTFRTENNPPHPQEMIDSEDWFIITSSELDHTGGRHIFRTGISSTSLKRS